jgi:predicted nucleic acid-binding protein
VTEVTLDTNVLIYSLDNRDPVRQQIAEDVIRHAGAARSTLTVVTLGEFYKVTTRKLPVTKALARQYLLDFSRLFRVQSYDVSDLHRAALESEAGRFEFWDAVMLSAAERAGCTICLSEDMADGAKLGGITVRNPFGAGGLTAAARTALGIP